MSNKHNVEDMTEQGLSSIMRQVLIAVNFIHSQGIIHRNLIPEHFLVNTKGEIEIKLSGFYCASTFESTDDIMDDIFGSLPYHSPEVVKGEYTIASDLWAVGVMLYLFISGKLPFHGDTQYDIKQRIKSAQLDYESGKLANISAPLKDLLKGLLNTNPKKRFTA